MDSWGTLYKDFVARLKGEPAREKGNERIATLRKEGRSQAFCQIYAEAYRGEPFPAPKDLLTENSWHLYAHGKAASSTGEFPED